MRLSELQEQARKLLVMTSELTSENSEKFLVKSGGVPNDYVGIKEFIVSQSHDYKYPTQWSGYAYECETVVKCTKTGVKDAKGREIYLLPDGETFVWEYRCGNVYNFDRGAFNHPTLEY